MKDADNFKGNPFASDDADNFKGDPFAAAPAQQPTDPDSQQQPTNTFGNEALRQLGLTARAGINVIASPVTVGGNILGKAVNAMIGRDNLNNGGRPIFDNSTDTLNRALTGLGLPEPTRPIERFTQGMAESAPAMALPLGAMPQIAGNAIISSALAPQGKEVSQALYGAAGGAALPALGKTAQLLGRGAANVLGTTTGAGAEPVRQAFKNAPGFVENMRGNVAASEVVDNARKGIQTIRQKMQADYRAAVPTWATNHFVDFAPVEQAFKNMVATMQHNGQWKIGPSEQRTIQEIRDVLTDFYTTPGNKTVEGLDAMKQRIQAIYPESHTHTQAQRAVTAMSKAIKEEIRKQSPAYAPAMENYWKQSAQLDEIERSLSLGDRNTIDTALRKLQSLMRNNVNSNFGQRVQSAQALEQLGGANVLPQVAGQALNSWTPRGLQGAAASSTGVGSLLLNPWGLATLPLFSPRTVGEAARGVGAVAHDPRTQAIVEALRRTTPAAVRSIENGE
jgi:hypothetical protein